MLIIDIGKLPGKYHVRPGDLFRLFVYGKLVMESSFEETTTITMGAYVKIKGNVGYIVGGDSLLDDLLSAGFRHAG